MSKVIGCWEYNNRFSIMDNFGNDIYFAREESSCMVSISLNNYTKKKYYFKNKKLFTLNDKMVQIFGTKMVNWLQMRMCCANLRAFTMPVTLSEDESEQVLTFERPLNCMGCCSSCCYPACMQVYMTSFQDDLWFKQPQPLNFITLGRHIFDLINQKTLY